VIFNHLYRSVRRFASRRARRRLNHSSGSCSPMRRWMLSNLGSILTTWMKKSTLLSRAGNVQSPYFSTSMASNSDTKVLFYQQAIVSRGTLCWLAKDKEGRECVIKDAWRFGSRKSEGEFLSLLMEKGAWSAVDCGTYGDTPI
jgi:Fungal protein kinase